MGSMLDALAANADVCGWCRPVVCRYAAHDQSRRSVSNDERGRPVVVLRDRRGLVRWLTTLECLAESASLGAPRSTAPDASLLLSRPHNSC